MLEKLKPCPFCGSLMCQSYYARESIYVRCNMCNATSGVFDDWEAAVKAWNRRTELKLDRTRLREYRALVRQLITKIRHLKENISDLNQSLDWAYHIDNDNEWE